jgi:hypothetical protein
MKKSLVWLIVIIFTIGCMPLGVFGAAETADSVYINGNIYTVNENAPKATAMAIKGQKLIYVGNDKDVKQYIGKSTKVIDLSYKTVIPGIIGSHTHVSQYSEASHNEFLIKAQGELFSYGITTYIEGDSVTPNGSDAPVGLVNPYYGLYTRITGMDRAGKPLDGWDPEKCITREDALKTFTIWAAQGQSEDNTKGSLEAGKLADFVILDRDIMTCPASDIKDANTLMTVLGGEVVYTREVPEEMTLMIMGEVSTIKPIMINNDVYVPVIPTVKALGLKCAADSKSITVIKDFNPVTLTIDSKTVSKNGMYFISPKAPKSVNGLTYMPISHFRYYFGYNVMNYRASNIISINF